eukprot:12847555-Alexandrium_andersonii.AAC.1
MQPPVVNGPPGPHPPGRVPRASAIPGDSGGARTQEAEARPPAPPIPQANSRAYVTPPSRPGGGSVPEGSP